MFGKKIFHNNIRILHNACISKQDLISLNLSLHYLVGGIFFKISQSFLKQNSNLSQIMFTFEKIY